jgi:hypothetical protein
MMVSSDDSPRRAKTAPMPPGRQTPFGTAGGFSAPPGPHVDPTSPLGYYVDLRSKAVSPELPPEWYPRVDSLPNVVMTQWGLACYEHHLAGDGADWLAAARWAADRLLDKQEAAGPQAGGWVNRSPYKHTYRLRPPWLSGMAQGQGASLLVRLHRETGEERYAEGAISALAPMWKAPGDGGVAARLDGGWLPEEYPTDPPSHVLNGAIFGIWGAHDVSLALGHERADALAAEGIATLAASLDRYDTGAWSRYDLFPHPTVHLASPMYHRLHINQLRAMTAISPDPRFPATAARFEGYAASRGNVARAYAHKVAFRLMVPRNRWLAHRLPWNRDRTR